jgi:hypothetical protein
VKGTFQGGRPAGVYVNGKVTVNRRPIFKAKGGQIPVRIDSDGLVRVYAVGLA